MKDLPPRDTPQAKEFGERLTRLYEQKVLGHPISTFAEGIEAVRYMLGTDDGRKLMRESAKESGAAPSPSSS